MRGEPLDLTTCVLDPAEAGRAYRRLQPEGLFQRFVESEGARRAVLGLQGQGLNVVLVTSDRQADNMSSMAKQDRSVDPARLSHVQRHMESGSRPATPGSRPGTPGLGGVGSRPAAPCAGLGDLELLLAARERRCLVAVPVERELGQSLEDILDLPPHMVKDMHVPYTFLEDGSFKFWLPPPAKRLLVRQRGSSPARASPGGRLLSHLRRPPSAGASRPQRVVEASAATARPPSARLWEDHRMRRPQDTSTPRRVAPLGSGRPETVEPCGVARPLEFTLGKSAPTSRGLVAASPSPLRRR